MAEIFIKKARKRNDCDWRKGNDCDWDLLEHMCFEDADWYIEGVNYCQYHAQKVVRVLNDNGAGIDPKKINWIDELVKRRKI